MGGFVYRPCCMGDLGVSGPSEHRIRVEAVTPAHLNRALRIVRDLLLEAHRDNDEVLVVGRAPIVDGLVDDFGSMEYLPEQDPVLLERGFRGRYRGARVVKLSGQGLPLDELRVVALSSPALLDLVGVDNDELVRRLAEVSPRLTLFDDSLDQTERW